MNENKLSYDMIRSYVWQWLIDMCNIHHSNMWRDSFIGLFCRISSLLQGSFAKETCNHWYVWHASFAVIWHDSFIRVAMTHWCDISMSHRYDVSMRHASFVRVIWLNSITGCTCVTWLISTCEMTFIVCDMTHSHVWHASFVRVTWLIHMCYTTHSYVWHDSFICVTWPIHTCVSTL